MDYIIREVTYSHGLMYIKDGHGRGRSEMGQRWVGAGRECDFYNRWTFMIRPCLYRRSNGESLPFGCREML
jgi:hypothetical protein